MIEIGLAPESGADSVEITFPAGLPGFPHATRFRLVPWHRSDDPFLTMVCCDDPEVSFVVAPPWAVYPDYQFDLDPVTTRRLSLRQPSDALVLCVVTLRERREDATLNLLGPIVVNRLTHEACQVVLLTAGYDLHAPLERPS